MLGLRGGGGSTRLQGGSGGSAEAACPGAQSSSPARCHLLALPCLHMHSTGHILPARRPVLGTVPGTGDAEASRPSPCPLALLTFEQGPERIRVPAMCQLELPAGGYQAEALAGAGVHLRCPVCLTKGDRTGVWGGMGSARQAGHGESVLVVTSRAQALGWELAGSAHSILALSESPAGASVDGS